jgi:uncharacterized protein (DUF58 family)
MSSRRRRTFALRATPRAALLMACASVLALVGLGKLMLIAMVGIIVVSIIDAFAVRNTPSTTREVGAFARGAPTPLQISVDAPGASRVQIRQPLPPDMTSPESTTTAQALDTVLVPLRRGSYVLPRVAARALVP